MEAFLRHYGPIGVFLGSAFEGQTAVIAGGLLARQHIMSLWTVLACASAGSGIIDHLLFVAGRRFRSHRWVARATEQAAFARALGFIERFPTSYILAFRFIYGMRLASPVAIGVTRIPAWRFAILNIVGAVIWAGASAGAGYVFGEALQSLIGAHHAARWTLYAVGGLVLLVGIVWIARRRKGPPQEVAAPRDGA